MDIQNNDLIKVFESYYRFKERYGEIPTQTFIHSIHAGIAGLERNQKEIIKQSIEDFQHVAQLLDTIYTQLYDEQSDVKLQNKNSPQIDTLTLDEVIEQYKLTNRIKSPQWREKNKDFPYHQPTGSKGKVLIYRSEIEDYIKTKKP